LSSVILTATVMFTSSCAEKQLAPALAPAPAPESAVSMPADEVDLSQAGEIFAAMPVAAAPALDPATVVATVNGEDIKQADVNTEVAKAVARMSGRVPPERMAQMQGRLAEQALDAMITRRLLLKAIEDENVEITDTDITEAMEKITASLPSGTTIEDIYTQSNVTADDFKKDLTTDLRINKLLEAHTENVPEPGEEALKSYYDDNKSQFEQAESVQASHILIAFEPDDTDVIKAEKKAKIEEIRKKLADGEDFAQCATENSDCPSKARGGDLGTFQSGQMVPEFEKAAFSQTVDEVGEIVETQFGYHIIKVSEHVEPKTIAFDEVKEKLAKYLRTQDRRKAAEDYIEELKSKSNVTIKTAAASVPAGLESATPPPSAPAM
ncbi:MAG: peptidylprolyl isomerase, partial [bacterium]